MIKSELSTTNGYYSADTDIMTASGWKNIRDIDVCRDTVLTLEPISKEIEMCRVRARVEAQLDKMLSFDTNRYSCCVSEDKKLLTFPPHASDIDFAVTSFAQAKDVFCKAKTLIRGVSWTGRHQDYFHLPACNKPVRYKPNETEFVPERLIKMNDWLEFFGFWLADGCVQIYGPEGNKMPRRVSLTQSVKNEEYVLDLLNRVGYEASVRTKAQNIRDYFIYDYQLVNYLVQFGKSTDKYIPREFLELDTEQLGALYKGYTFGDMTVNASNGSYILSTVSPLLIENIRELILKLMGVVVQYSMYDYEYYVHPLYQITSKLNDSDQCFARYGNHKTIKGSQPGYGLLLEKDNILLIRHNGIMSWC